MKKRMYRVIGPVLEKVSGSGISGRRVEAWDKDLIRIVYG